MKKTALFVVCALAMVGCKKKSAGETPARQDQAKKKMGAPSLAMKPRKPEKRATMAAAMGAATTANPKKTTVKTPVPLGKYVRATAPAYDVAAQFGTKVPAAMIIQVDLKALLTPAIVKKEVGGLIMKGARQLKECARELSLESLDTALMVSSSNKLIGKPGTEKARFAAVSFTKPMNGLFACLKKSTMIVPAKTKGLFVLKNKKETFLSMPSPTRLLLAKGEWVSLLTKKGILGSGDVLSRLSGDGVYFYAKGDGKEVIDMKIRAAFTPKFALTANIAFTSEPACKVGIAKFDFLNKLPPKMRVAFEPLKYGTEKGSLSVHFAGTPAEARRLMEVVSMMFFLRGKGGRGGERPVAMRAKPKPINPLEGVTVKTAMEPTMGPISWTSVKRKKPAAAKK